MNIYQKLIEVRKSVPYLQKDNTGHQFKYVSSSQTLGSLKKAMDEHGIMLIPNVKQERVLDHTTSKGAHWYFTVLDMDFTWVNADNPEERVVCGWTGQGLDDGEKGVGKALTYAEKYFMLKFFNIPTDKDDPDSFQKETDKGSNKAIAKKPEPEKPRDDIPEKLGEAPKEEYPEFDNTQEIKELKKKLNAMMKGFNPEQKVDFFGFVLGGNITVDSLQEFIDKYDEYRTQFMKARQV